MTLMGLYVTSIIDVGSHFMLLNLGLELYDLGYVSVVKCIFC